MSTGAAQDTCNQTELVCAYALGALPESEAAALHAHIAKCSVCLHELSTVRPIVDAFASWPTDILRPSPSLWSRLASRAGIEEIAGEALFSTSRFAPEWEEVAPGISCQLLATDAATDHVSMLVRLAPGAEYPPHLHAAREELHLLDGELWIDDKKLRPGDYRCAEAGTHDRWVWSETGCTCFLMTSARDALC